MTTQRQIWIDFAKGVAIILVVLTHSISALRDHGAEVGPWIQIDGALATLRMPLFFIISGFFAAKSMQVPASLFLRYKVGNFIYIYTVWSVFYAGMAAALHVGSGTSGSATIRSLYSAISFSGILWYLIALPVFFTLARSTRAIPRIPLIIAASIVSLLFAGRIVHTGSWGMDHMGQYLVWFLVGLHMSHRVRKWIAAARAWYIPVFGVLWIGSLSLMTLLEGRSEWIWAALVSVPAVAFSLCVAYRIAPWGSYVTLLGRNTIGVYVLHGALISLIAPTIMGRLGAMSSQVWPLVVTTAVAGLSVLIHNYLKRLPGVFHLPMRPPRRAHTTNAT
jgi:uncharacterized membrane protein YcfT